MELNVQDQSGHWRNALEFLKIIFGYLDNQNGQISASSLKDQTANLTEYWSRNPMLDSVYVLGSNLEDGFISISPIKIDMHSNSQQQVVADWAKNL